jgi:hypothetical protein
MNLRFAVECLVGMAAMGILPGQGPIHSVYSVYKLEI